MKSQPWSKLQRCLAPLSVALAALAAAGGPGLARADPRSVGTPWLDLNYDSAQLPDDQWRIDIFLDMPSLFQTNDGTWHYEGGGPMTIRVVPLEAGPDNGFVEHLDLSLRFKGSYASRIDASTFLISTALPASAQFTSISRLGVPDGAQLATSLGRDALQVTANGSEVHGKTLQPLAAAPWVYSYNDTGAAGWASAPAPAEAGLWQLSIDHSLIGSSYLVPSNDPACVSITCMPAVRGAVSQNELTIWMPISFAFGTAPVPEPATGALMACGLWCMAALRRRSRSGRSGE